MTTHSDGIAGLFLKTVSLATVVLCWTGAAAFGQSASYPDFEIVESIPAGTTLDNPDVRNTQEVWLEMIHGAKKSLDIEEFYISDQKGEPLEEILKAIRAAAGRGVAVRLVIDSRMHKTYPDPADLLGKVKNIELRVIDYGTLAGGVQHSKYFIVDGKEVFLGSQNFDWRSLKHIHEIGVRVRHPGAVQVYQDVFETDWSQAGMNRAEMAKEGLAVDTYVPKRNYPVPFHLVEKDDDTIAFSPTFSPRGLIPDSALWDETQIIRLIDRAKFDVMCQVLTYSPVTRNKTYYAELDNAMRRAAARGVRVKLVVSDWSKEHPVVDYLKSLSLVPNIEVKFSVIPEWSGGYVSYARVEHCKYLVIDSSHCWIGTANWEKSYFYNTRNVGVSVQSPRIAQLMRRIFLKGWTGPYTESVKPEVDYQARRHGD